METKDIVLTDEMRKQLNDVLGFEVEASFVYVPKAYRKSTISKSQWPVFTLRSKDGLEIAEAEDNSGYFEYDSNDKNKSKLVMQSGKARVETLRKGILKVKNFLIENGKVISFDASKDDIDIFIKKIKPKLQLELQEAINERDTLTADEMLGLES
jgi:hypothetical protein